MTAVFLQLKPGWKEQETQALFFLLKLLFLITIVKFLFYLNNPQVLKGSDEVQVIHTIGWALFYDILVIALINIPFLVLLSALSFWKKKIVITLLNFFFILANVFNLLINSIDIFYFNYHGQRANADLLYVLKDPIQKALIQNTGYSVLALVASALIFFLVYRLHTRLLKAYYQQGRRFNFGITASIGILFIVLVPFRIVVPTYPLVNIKSNELQLAQNSLHSFTYSVYRNKEGMVKPFTWMSDDETSRFINPVKSVSSSINKNVVLFIMESIPEEFFNPASKYKVFMPFVDSLLTHSTYYANTYSYAHHSNKGIVSILAGLPTLTEIPLYHSPYANLPKTEIGTVLNNYGYNSFFTIGDSYDDFGFAKCINWLGIKNYYSKENIPGYKKISQHTMGMHDEYMLDFFARKIGNSTAPFFAVNYNISTHAPYDLPAGYKNPFPGKNFTEAMVSMNYYAECLRNFFYQAAKQPWYSNTVFIFCSDHWMFPEETNVPADLLQGFRIPLFIFDPQKNKNEIVNGNVSQLDVMNTVLNLAGVKDKFISYGETLLDTLPANRIVFMRENNTLYQAADSQYLVGFNPVSGKTEFVYNYKTDINRKYNLANTPLPETHIILESLKAFLQKASWQYVQKTN